MDQLWGIALRAQSADISRAAIQYINSYYINGLLERTRTQTNVGLDTSQSRYIHTQPLGDLILVYTAGLQRVGHLLLRNHLSIVLFNNLFSPLQNIKIMALWERV